MPFSTTLDQVGYFGADLTTTAAAAPLLLDGWDSGPPQPDVGAIAVPDGPYLDQATRHGRDEFERTIDRLRRGGIDILRIPALARIGEINRDHQRLVAAEMARVHRPWFEEHRHLYRQQTLRVIEPGLEISDMELEDLVGRQGENQRIICQEMEDAGVGHWVCPPAVDSAPRGLSMTGDPIMNLPWTHAGLPAISLPTHLDSAGLPHGVQIVGRPGADEALLAVTARIEPILGYASPLT